MKMKKIDKETINYLPVHDSELLGIKITQKDNGETNLVVHIAFCKGEFEDITEYAEFIKPDGRASFMFMNCEWINVNTVCNRAQRDEIDYIRFPSKSSELTTHKIREDEEYVEVVFISGSKIECIVKSVALIRV